MTLQRFLNAAAAALLLPAACLYAQDDTALPVVRRPSIGLRFQYSPTRYFQTSSGTASTTQPIADYTYSGSSTKGGLVLTPNVEYRLTKRLTAGLEFQFHHAQYTQITQVRSGKKDPNSATDTRPVATITETTRSSYWELPLRARYYGLSGSGLLSRTYLGAGLAFRHVANIRTGNEYSNADGSTDYNEKAVIPNATNQLGLVAEMGLRFVDAYRIKVTPEMRLTRWSGATFSGPAYRSASNQVSVGLGFSF